MSANKFTDRLGLPQYISTDTFDPLDEINKGNRDADKNAALSVDAFIPCAATYDTVTKRHTLIPAQAGIVLPEVFTVRFRTVADFTAGDKVYIGGKEYTPAYTDGAEAVRTGAWVLGAAVGLTCVQAVAKAFVGAGFMSQMGEKANITRVYSTLPNVLSNNVDVLGKITQAIMSGIEKGTFYTVATVDVPYNAMIRFTSNRSFTGTATIEAIEFASPKIYLRGINTNAGEWIGAWKEIPTTEKGIWDIIIVGAAGGTPVYASRAATYTRTGNTVIVSGRATLSSKGNLSGAIRIKGLPFAAKTVGVPVTVTADYLTLPTGSTTSPIGQLMSAGTIQLFKITPAGYTSLYETELKDNFNVSINACYEIA